MLIVTPNTCTDITSWLGSLVPGSVVRSSRTAVSAGGKGVNVCRTLRALGSDPRLIGLSARNDHRFEQLLEVEGCRFLPIYHEGVSRVALIMIEDDGRTSVINGQGPTADQWDRSELLPRVEAELDSGHRFDAVICSGSLPPGLALDTYARVVKAAHSRSVPAAVDAAPVVLGQALEAEPDLVSPNLSEAEALLHGREDEPVEVSGPDVVDRCIDAARELHQRGARRAVVTAGSHGAALATSVGAWWLGAGVVKVANPIGAGDSFLAGTVFALTGGANDLDAVRHGVAVAAAAVQHEQPGMIDPAVIPSTVNSLPPSVLR